ncbi:MAG: nitrate- and nitrite sensing domain-containing protein [Campylobacteraceae bacterium]|jgi:signal transduction histidine kinase/CheY-like chemotaxis protein|nr:nitrate- and nitrite sensing domain-containing protein [Campylobacteraceae bacterium]
MRTENTLKLISLIPLLILFSFSSYYLYLSFDNYRNVATLNSNMKENNLLGELLVALAAERGLSNTYVSSNGVIGSDMLAAKGRAPTDKAYDALKAYHRANPKALETKTSAIVNNLDNLASMRERIDSLSIDANDMFFNYYSVIISLILERMKESTFKVAANSQITSLNIALASSFNDIEFNGQERGFISGLLGLYKPISPENLEMWISIASKTNTLSAIAVRPEETQQKIDSLVNKPDSQRIINDIEQVKAEIMLVAQTGEFLIDPTVWFTMMSNKIEIITGITSIIKDSLKVEVDNFFKLTIIQLAVAVSVWLISFILLIIGYIMSKNINKNILELGKVFTRVEELAGTKEKLDLRTSKDTTKAYGIIDKALESIAEEKRKAEDASYAKSIFLANMSHEIRTPLNGIIGFTELLKNTDLDGEKLEFLEVIEKSSENLLDIINNVLDLSKIESNKVEIDEIPFLPIPEFENAIEVYGPKATEKNIQLTSYIHPGLTDYLKGDITKIKEVIINLLSNAVKFTPQNGSINVVIDRGTSVKRGYANVIFSVEDTGIGIQESKIGEIFNAFSQADSTITRKYGGTGLGLTISSQYVALMGGKLQVESKEGRGSKFYFAIDLIETPSSEIRLQNRYSHFVCAMLSVPGSKKNHEKIIKTYLEYFGATVRSFTKFDELKDLIYKSGVNSVIVNLENLSAEDIKEYKKIKLPILTVLKPQDQKRIEEIMTQYVSIMFEPINITKLVKFLDQGRDLIPKDLKAQAPQPTQPQATEAEPKLETPTIFDKLDKPEEKTKTKTTKKVEVVEMIDPVGKPKIQEFANSDMTIKPKIEPVMTPTISVDVPVGLKGEANVITPAVAIKPQVEPAIAPKVSVDMPVGLKGETNIIAPVAPNTGNAFYKVPADKLENNTKFSARVLVAEDNEINQKLIKRTLEDIGLEIVTAANGLLAFEERQKGGYDIVFMDIAMPVMDGVEATHKILQYEKKHNMTHVPIVAITANALKGDREKFMSEGLDEYVTKPIKKDSILRVLNMFIPHKAVRDEKLEQELAKKFSSIIQEDEPVSNTVPAESNNVVEPEKVQNESIEQSKAKPTKDILVCKKSSLETRVFADMVKKINGSVDSATSIEDFKELIQSTDYKLILIDKEVTIEPSLKSIITSIKNSNGNTKVALFYELDKPSSMFDGLADVISHNIATRVQLQELIAKYL